MTMAMRTTGRISGSIYATLLERLVSGEYQQNAKLSVENLRTQFTVSKQPIMEALRLLSADGLVEIVPQVGCVTMSYPPREIADFYNMFAGFEGAIAATAADRRTEGQLTELADISARIGDLRSNPDPRRRATQYRTLNREFHSKIHEMAQSRVMVETSRRMWDLSDYLINTSGSPQPLASVTAARHDDHEAIRDAIIAGDSAKARETMAAHISQTAGIIRTEKAAAEQGSTE